MSSRWSVLAVGALFVSQEANAARVISGARPTAPLPTMLDGQDLLVGSQYNGAGGAAYLVLGPVSGTLDLALADAKLVGARGDAAGISVSGAGDVDADGHSDVLVGVFQRHRG
jgi:hypothetical protein